MKTVVTDLLQLEEEAKQTLAKAQAYHDNIMQEVKEQKKTIQEQLKEHAHCRIQKVADAEQEVVKENEVQIKEKFLLQQQKLTDTYESNHKQWEDTLFQRCIGGDSHVSSK